MTGFVLNLSLPISIVTPILAKFINLSEKTKKQDLELLKEFTPAFGVIATKENNSKAWIQAGKAFERLWLLAVSQGLSCAPLAAIIQNTTTSQQLQKLLGSFYIPQVFFRLGVTFNRKNGGMFHTPRCNLQDVLSSKE